MDEGWERHEDEEDKGGEKDEEGEVGEVGEAGEEEGWPWHQLDLQSRRRSLERLWLELQLRQCSQEALVPLS